MRQGATWDGQGTTFRLLAPRAERVELLLDGRRLPLERGDDGWEVRADAPPGTRYAFAVDGGPPLIDPYADAVSGRIPDARAVVVDHAFDWLGDTPPRTPWRETVIYECHVKGLTQLHPQVPAERRGTYLGLCSPPVVAHLRHLGVTAVELLPVHQSGDEPHLAPLGLINHWGYNPLALLAPEARYASGDRGQQVHELKILVRELHRAGLEVILDVVFNHTAEGGRDGRTLSLRGVDPGYYHDDDWTGCGNSVDASSDLGYRLLVDGLTRWVTDYHVDGFRFDLAPVMARDRMGARTDLLEALAIHPALRGVKLIAEPWDLGPDGYWLGRFPAGWAEWNGKCRDTLRQAWRGEPVAGELATRLAGSSDLFGGRGPLAGISFVTCHDGFTLQDLVSYEQKHNLANGEDNRDGCGQNWSRNWGVEGETDDAEVLAQRERIKRGLLLTLACSQGVPMLSMGDELSRTQGGNNNAYCQDNAISWVDWELDERREAFLRFAREAFALRRRHPVLRSEAFFSGAGDLAWLSPGGGELCGDAWHAARAFGAHYRQAGLLLLFNLSPDLSGFELPPGRWRVELDTAEGGASEVEGRCQLPAFTCGVLAKS